MVRFSNSEVRFLEKNEIGRLATALTTGMPHVVPVSYLYQDGIFWVAVDYDTKKYRNLLANDRVALVVDVLNPNRGLLIQGRAEIVERGPEFRRAYVLFHKRFSWVRADPWKEGEAPFVKIVPFRKSSWGIT
jgi:nitroimidazol reductase NimA-like FMN-containing flavoprotein (pyridoxamine 5'-phosphate oxidase superfamily)